MKASAGSRVLMLLENNPYPQDPRVRQEAVKLAAAGYQVSVIAPRASEQPFRECLCGVDIHRYPAPSLFSGSIGYVWEYGYALVAMFVLSLKVWLTHGFDVVHIHNPPDTTGLVAAFYKVLGKQFVYDHHDLAPEMYRARLRDGGSRLMYHTLVAFETFCCRLADHVIATNESYKRVEMERGNVAEERITVVRNAPDPGRVRPVEPDPELRQQASTIIGYVGVMGPQDGVDRLLRALRHLIYDLEKDDVLCVLIGTGETWADLQHYAIHLGLQDHVWFTGRISDSDLIRYLSTTDICVDPDPSNPFNDRSTMIKMMEYMTLGKPIVAFDLPEHRVTAQSAALYAIPNDETDFARAIARLIDDPALRQRMGLAGQQRVRSDLTWAASAQNLLAAYRRLCLTQQNCDGADDGTG